MPDRGCKPKPYSPLNPKPPRKRLVQRRFDLNVGPRLSASQIPPRVSQSPSEGLRVFLGSGLGSSDKPCKKGLLQILGAR